MWQNWEVKTDEIFLIQSTIIQNSKEHQALKFIRVLDWLIIVFKLQAFIPLYVLSGELLGVSWSVRDGRLEK